MIKTLSTALRQKYLVAFGSQLQRESDLRKWLTQAKDLLDEGYWHKGEQDYTPEELEEWQTKWAKFEGWLAEYEALVLKLAQFSVEPTDRRCGCGGLILVAWENRCGKCN